MIDSKRLLSLTSFCVILIITFGSCSNSDIALYEDEKPVTIETIQAYQTPLTPYNYPGQVTDENLMLSAELTTAGCVRIDQAMKIKLIFTNLTPLPLIITSEFNIINGGMSGGNLITTITKTSGERILTLADVNIASDTFYRPPSNYTTITGDDSEEFFIDYYFPDYVIKSAAEKTLVTSNSGEYLIRFIYSDYKREIDNWDGTISSNHIKVCLS